MKQGDLFEETLEKKIYRMEKWMSRLQKELWFLKEVSALAQQRSPAKQVSRKVEQLDIFAR